MIYMKDIGLTAREVDEINDKEYFDYLVDTYQKLVFSLCFKACGNRFDAEDLTQDTFISVYKNLSTFDKSYEKAWVCKIASNKCLDFLKSAKRRTLPTDDEILDTYEDGGATPEDEYLQKESKLIVYGICQKLKEPYRTVATEHFSNEKSVSEIAYERGSPKKTVQTQVYRAKAMIRKIMREESRR